MKNKIKFNEVITRYIKRECHRERQSYRRKNMAKHSVMIRRKIFKNSYKFTHFEKIVKGKKEI